MADTKLNLVVTPPKAGRKGSSADSAIVEAMSEQIGEGTYVTDGKTYETGAEAVNAANIYRRAVSSSLNVDAYTVVSRVWGEDAKGKPIKRDAKGTWRFALTRDPNRKKGDKSGAAAA